MSVFLFLLAAVLLMLGVLGHSIWHGGEIAVANVIVEVFTGGHVTG